MCPLQQDHLIMLENTLEAEFVPKLPPLLDKSKSAAAERRKNLSRAFSAFAIYNLCRVPVIDCAKAVIDDFDDFGIDAIFFHAPTDTLYLIQSKLKASEQFSQEEALAYCQGIRKLIRQDFTGFNTNVQNRKVEIEDALDNCSHIQLVVAHTGSGISKHARQAIDELLADEDHGEERLRQVIDYDSSRVVVDLRSAKAYERIDTELWVQKCSTVSEPRVTYFGLVQLDDLVKLHKKHGKGLYEKNIRTFLGHTTEVNVSIRQTLAKKQEDFLYLNNGVTALCQEIHPKSSKLVQNGKKRLVLKGFSVINGAQTIASSASYLAENDDNKISDAKVSITLIKTDADGTFGKAVTRARNHQNQVHFSNFAALDDEQERLRRELAYLGIHYAYKAEGSDGVADPNRIRIDEAAQALALLQPDPRFIVWLKKEPARLLNTTSEQYKVLFTPTLSAFQLVNAVRLNRYVQARMAAETNHAAGLERLAYKHGNFAVAWVLSKRIKTEIDSAKLLDSGKINTVLSAPFDNLRQTHWDKTRMAAHQRGPLSLFRNQTFTIPLLQEIAIVHFGLENDKILGHKLGQQKMGQPYPEELFNYIISKAPQIGNLS